MVYASRLQPDEALTPFFHSSANGRASGEGRQYVRADVFVRRRRPVLGGPQVDPRGEQGRHARDQGHRERRGRGHGHRGWSGWTSLVQPRGKAAERVCLFIDLPPCRCPLTGGLTPTFARVWRPFSGVPPIRILQQLQEKYPGLIKSSKTQIFLDGGISRGTDVLKVGLPHSAPSPFRSIRRTRLTHSLSSFRPGIGSVLGCDRRRARSSVPVCPVRVGDPGGRQGRQE